MSLLLPLPLKRRLARIAAKEERDLGAHIRHVLLDHADAYEQTEKKKNGG